MSISRVFNRKTKISETEKSKKHYVAIWIEVKGYKRCGKRIFPYMARRKVLNPDYTTKVKSENLHLIYRWAKQLWWEDEHKYPFYVEWRRAKKGFLDKWGDLTYRLGDDELEEYFSFDEEEWE